MIPLGLVNEGEEAEEIKEELVLIEPLWDCHNEECLWY